MNETFTGKGDRAGSFEWMTAIMIAGLVACVCRAGEQRLAISNSNISVALDSSNATFSVTDRRTGQTWRQKATDKFKVLDCRRIDGGLEMTCRHSWYELDSTTILRLDGDKPELTLELHSWHRLLL